jgi:isopropylmalate/homocitrate/citramalate synthase
MVGARRYLCLGVHSGKKSLKLKCDCLGLKVTETQLTELLSQVKELSVSLERSLTDQELRTLYLSLKDDKPKRPKKTTEEKAPVLTLRQSLANC